MGPKPGDHDDTENMTNDDVDDEDGTVSTASHGHEKVAFNTDTEINSLREETEENELSFNDVLQFAHRINSPLLKQKLCTIGGQEVKKVVSEMEDEMRTNKQKLPLEHSQLGVYLLQVHARDGKTPEDNLLLCQ